MPEGAQKLPEFNEIKSAKKYAAITVTWVNVGNE